MLHGGAAHHLRTGGGGRLQRAVRPAPRNFEYAVIEVNPRVSSVRRPWPPRRPAIPSPRWRPRSPSVTGWTRFQNAVTGTTSACFEPALDYVVVKFPKWPFDKFVYASRRLGTQMKATGEVMAIGQTFEEALMKAVRGAEISRDFLGDERFRRDGKRRGCSKRSTRATTSAFSRC